MTVNPPATSHRLRQQVALWLGCWFVVAGLASGCRSISIDTARRLAGVASIGNSNSIGAKPIKRVHRLGPVARLFAHSPAPSERTQQLMRRYVLDDQYALDPDAAIRRLKAYAEADPGLERTHAVAELAWQQGEWASRLGQTQRAMRMYATALESSYRFLFDAQLDLARNAYDPQFRSISDIYNLSLEALLRRLIKEGEFHPGAVVRLETIDSEIQFRITVPGRWKHESIERFELVNDYKVQGLNNQFRTWGLGVPLIAVRSGTDPTEDSFEEHYPPNLTMALTAFLQLAHRSSRDPYGPAAGEDEEAVLSLVDPLEQTVLEVENRMVPLQSDITTPMAWYLNDPLLNTNVFATLALLNADFANNFEGLYMLEPYDPNKIPVVMIHGLWSSPVTWLQMFNDLRADRDIHTHYQFWFCLYPTGQPWWESARQVRAQLAAVRDKLGLPADSASPYRPFDQMVLVGHSMGGLVGRMQTIESGDRFWNQISEQPVSSWKGEPETLKRLQDTFVFEPNPSVRRLITLATPHRGSSYANNTTQWLGRKAISLPQAFTGDYAAVVAANRSLILNPQLVTMATSVDSLSPENPFFAALLAAPQSRGVINHNIYGAQTQNALKMKLGLAEEGDGVVSVESARIEDALTEIEIDAAHNSIHQNPLAILEVKKILLQHLVETSRLQPVDTIQPVSGEMLQPLRKEALIPSELPWGG